MLEDGGYGGWGGIVSCTDMFRFALYTVCVCVCFLYHVLHLPICGHACVVNFCRIECLSLQSSESVCMRGSERNGCIFRLASMRWDSTLQGLAASRTTLLPRKHAAAWHPRGATQFDSFWPF